MSSILIFFVVFFLPTSISQSAKTSPRYSLAKSDLLSLDGHYTNATLTNETKYPWIGKLIHASRGDYPMLCTVSCVHEQIFLTSARCLVIYSVKVSITRIVYQNLHFEAKAFLLPPEMKHSKQYFDDIGLIVTEEGPPGFNWAIVALPTAAVAYRTKGPEYNTYKWFEDLNFVYLNATHTVIGYGYKNKAEAAARAETMHYELVELNVIVGINYCEKFYEIQDNYHVPCYHYCNLTSIRNGWAENCAAKNIAVEGAAVYNFKKKELLGVASWSIKIPMGESPVGFAVPNTEEFYKNFKCAQTIASDILPHPGKGYFNWLCKLQQ